MPSRLRMATILRLQVFGQREVNLAMEILLAQISARLDTITGDQPSIVSAIGFFWRRWADEIRPQLEEAALQVLREDPEISSMVREHNLDEKSYERAARTLARREIDHWFPVLQRRAERLAERRMRLH